MYKDIILTCFFVSALSICATSSSAQQTVIGSHRFSYDAGDGVEVSSITGKMRIGPHPERTGELFNMLRFEEIRRELKFTQSQSEAFEQMRKEERELFAQCIKNGQSPVVTIQTLRSRNNAAFEEVLTPEQSKRLVEIAYRAEVSVLGLSQALTDGQLGESVGVYANQRDTLIRKGSEIEKRVLAEIRLILNAAENELLAELSPDQRDKAKNLLGPYFAYPRTEGLKDSVTRINEERSLRNLTKDK